MYSRHDQHGLQLVRLGLWSLVVIATAFFVPRAGLSMLFDMQDSVFLAIIVGVPLIILKSALPCAIAFEYWMRREYSNTLQHKKLLTYLLVTAFVIIVWAVAEPYLYLGYMHPNGFARYETMLLMGFGLTFATVTFLIATRMFQTGRMSPVLLER